VRPVHVIVACIGVSVSAMAWHAVPAQSTNADRDFDSVVCVAVARNVELVNHVQNHETTPLTIGLTVDDDAETVRQARIDCIAAALARAGFTVHTSNFGEHSLRIHAGAPVFESADIANMAFNVSLCSHTGQFWAHRGSIALQANSGLWTSGKARVTRFTDGYCGATLP